LFPLKEREGWLTDYQLPFSVFSQVKEMGNQDIAQANDIASLDNLS